MFEKCLSVQFLYSLFLSCEKPFFVSIMSRYPHRDRKKLSRKLDKVLYKKNKKDLKRIGRELRYFLEYKRDGQSLVYLGSQIFNWSNDTVNQGLQRMGHYYEYPSSMGYEEQFTIMKDGLQQHNDDDSKHSYDDSNNGTIKNTKWLLKSLSTATGSGLHFECSLDGHCNQSIDNTQRGESKQEEYSLQKVVKPVHIDEMIFEEALIVREKNPKINSNLKRKEINQGIEMINTLQHFINYYTPNNT